MACRSALVSDSTALSQAPTKATRLWTHSSAYVGTRFHCLVTEAMCVNNLPEVALYSAVAGIESAISSMKS